jgi:serine/threonine-protein kinase
VSAEQENTICRPPGPDSTTDDLRGLALSKAEVGPPAEAWTVPKSLAGYAVIRPLGRGGMGEVFLAFDPLLGRQVAVKRIRPELAHQDEVRRRFEVEARVTAVLQHPAIVPIYQLAGQGDQVCYAMRPIEGMSLADLIAKIRANESGYRQEYPLLRLVRWFLQAANAIAYAHSRGVIHRDLKPSNIMIGPFEEVLVLDWGMAKILESSPAAPDDGPQGAARPRLGAETSPYCVAGTIPYMPPEQIRGELAHKGFDAFALGVILYEILALALPWPAGTPDEVLEARARPPEHPGRVQPGRGIPTDLARAALKALECEPAQRYGSVTEFARDVAHAIEGRASWQAPPQDEDLSLWNVRGGKLKREAQEFVLCGRAPYGLLQVFCRRRFANDVRLEFEFNTGRDHGELAVCLTENERGAKADDAGYCCVVVPGRRQTVSLTRSGRVVAGAKSPSYEPRRWYKAVVSREDDYFSLAIDGETVYAYHDPIPLPSRVVSFRWKSQGKSQLRSVRAYSRGASATVSCLAVPDALFHRGLYEEARTEYERIAESHPGRSEGRLSAYRAGLCMLELADKEKDAEVRRLLVDEAAETFRRHCSGNDSCLLALGQAMVAMERDDLPSSYESLAAALEGYADDPHVPAAREWLLAWLHSRGNTSVSSQRRAVADLLPLALTFCADGWGRRVVQDLLDDVHRSWEIPSFMTSRGRFKEGDRVSLAETRLFFAFWAARPEIIEGVVRGLCDRGEVRPHHLADGVLSLLELGSSQRALALSEEAQRSFPPRGDSKVERILRSVRSAALAANGSVEEAERLHAGSAPDAFDRAYNSARLWLARGFHAGGEPHRALKALRPLGPQDGFAREQQAWLRLGLGQPDDAERLLKPLVERNEHRRGRNLSNFLHGVTLEWRRKGAEARRVFSYLEPAPWPRTWTLGSHYALGRLGDGDVEAYRRGAFDWERKQLAAQAKLLAAARGG